MSLPIPRVDISDLQFPSGKIAARSNIDVERLSGLLTCLALLPPSRIPQRLADQHYVQIREFQEVPCLKASGLSEITQ